MSTGVCAYLWASMGVHRSLWVFMRVYGSLWINMTIEVLMDVYGENMGVCYK